MSFKTYRRTTDIEQHTGWSATSSAPDLKVFTLRTVTTEHPLDEDVDGAEVRAFVDRLHAARVALESLSVGDRDRANFILDNEGDIPADLEADYIERAVAAVTR
jgi:hypothetical protein